MIVLFEWFRQQHSLGMVDGEAFVYRANKCKRTYACHLFHV